MRTKFETFYKVLMVLLAIALLWAVWASVQNETRAAGLAAATTNAVVTDTNSTPRSTSASPTNADAGTLLPGIKQEYLTFWLDHVPFLTNHRLFGEPLWRYFASFIYIFLAFYVSKFLDYATRVWLKRLAARTETKFDDLLLDVLNGPIKVVAFVVFLHIGLSLFQWTEVIQKIISKGLKIIVACSLTYMAIKLVDLLLGAWRQRLPVAEEDKQFNQLFFPMIRKSLKAFVVIVAVLVTAQNIGMDITGLIASLSIGGLALGLAAQDTVANLFGAVSIFVDKPFHIGDRIQLEGVDGSVESIGLRSTRVRNLDGHLITIPNKTMGNATITNITKRPNIKTVMNIGVTYDTPAGRVQLAVNILNEIFRGHPKTSDVWISFNAFADSSLNILVIHWWGGTDYKEYLHGMQELNLTIKKRFDDEGLNFAFPSRTVYLKQDSEFRVQSLPPAALSP
jgi:MscS family membrane protein